MSSAPATPATPPSGERSLIARCTQWMVLAYDHYESDPFVRTKTDIIALQILMTLTVMGIVIVLYNINTVPIHEGIFRSHLQRSLSQVLAVSEEVEQFRLFTLYLGIALSLFAGTMFGFLIASVALAPVRRALESQEQFIRDVAHELRTPLSILKATSEVACMGNNDSTALRETLRSNIQEVDRLSEVINCLFTITTLESTQRPEFTTVDLRKVAVVCIDLHLDIASSRGVKVVLAPGEEAPVIGNRAALEQICTNILDNALKYTGRGGLVVVSVAPSFGGFMQLQIRDSGIGISGNDLEHIFKPFFRADSSRTRSHGGIGIGLTIVSELVKLHKGSVGVESTPGAGTVVSIRIPMA